MSGPPLPWTHSCHLPRHAGPGREDPVAQSSAGGPCGTGIHTPRWSCCRLCSDWSRWSPSAPSPRGASSCCPSAPSLLCTTQPRAGNCLSSHSGFWSQIPASRCSWVWPT